jgi:FkbM family methyltransferase
MTRACITLTWLAANADLVPLAEPIYDLTAATAARGWPRGARSSSQSREDAALFYTYFARDLGYRGTFVEIGALDGEMFSNTKVFEERLGWRGLLIEGAPGNAQKLMRPGVRPNATKLPLAVCPAGQGTVMMQGEGAIATDVADASDAFINRWHRGKRDRGVAVACKPFGEMLRAAGLHGGVDVASIDVEGAELKVLETMDWSIPVRVWVVEVDGSSPAKDTAVRRLLRSRAYCRAPGFLPDYCGAGPPAEPRPLNPKFCTMNEAFERCRPALVAAEAACPLDVAQRACKLNK